MAAFPPTTSATAIDIKMSPLLRIQTHSSTRLPPLLMRLGTVFENHRKSLIQHYVYILSGQKLIKNGPFWRVFENCQNSKVQMRHFE